jgi:hypothetical protein
MREAGLAEMLARMTRYGLIPTMIACAALLAIAAAAGAERGSSAAVPKRVLKQIEQAKSRLASRSGAMGIHYLNGDLIADPALDFRKPEILLYEPQADGALRLVGIEYFVLDTAQDAAPRILGRSFQGPMTHGGTAPSHYHLHVWTVKRNPRGLFAQYNPRVSC